LRKMSENSSEKTDKEQNVIKQSLHPEEENETTNGLEIIKTAKSSTLKQGNPLADDQIKLSISNEPSIPVDTGRKPSTIKEDNFSIDNSRKRSTSRESNKPFVEPGIISSTTRESSTENQEASDIQVHILSAMSKSIPETTVTIAEADEDQMIEKIKISQNIKTRTKTSSFNYDIQARPRSEAASVSGASEVLDPEKFPSEKSIPRRSIRVKNNQFSSKSDRESISSAENVDLLDPSKILFDSIMQKKLARAREKQSSPRAQRAKSVASSKGRDTKQLSQTSRPASVSSLISSDMLDSNLTFDELKKKNLFLDHVKADVDGQSTTASMYQKGSGPASEKMSPAGSQMHFFGSTSSEIGGRKVSAMGAFGKPINLHRRISSLSKHSDISSASSHKKITSREAGIIQEQAYARFSKLADSKHRGSKSSMPGLSHKLMRHLSTSKTAEKYKPQETARIPRGHVESPVIPQLSPKESLTMQTTSSTSSSGKVSDNLSELLFPGKMDQKLRAASRKSSAATTSDINTTAFFRGGQFNLLARLADYLTEERFINDEDHLMFIQTVKHMATVEIPEPIIHSIKKEVLPILKVRNLVRS